MQAYSSKEHEKDKYALPDVEVFELTAEEVALMDEDLVLNYMSKPEYRLAAMNTQDREKMIDAIISENSIEGGWFWWTCLPGCLPDSVPFGPFATAKEALEDAQAASE
jgi:hypothetical protein